MRSMFTAIAGMDASTGNPCAFTASTTSALAPAGKIAAAGAPQSTSGAVASSAAATSSDRDTTATLPMGCGWPVTRRR